MIMSRKGGHPDFKKMAEKHIWKKGDPKAVEAAHKSHEVRRQKKIIFATMRSYAEVPADEKDLSESLIAFWEKRGIPKEEITAMMVDISPMLADAIKAHDLDSYYKLMEMLGLTFNSTKEQNVKLTFENSLNANVSGEMNITFEEKKPESVED